VTGGPAAFLSGSLIVASGAWNPFVLAAVSGLPPCVETAAAWAGAAFLSADALIACTMAALTVSRVWR
jgi:hypothetical protein